MGGAANLVFTFGSHAMMPEEIREMAEPKRMHCAYNIAYAFVVPLYAAFGFVGFWAYGVFNSGSNLMLNFEDTLVVQVYQAVAVITGYLPLVLGQLVLFLKLELWLRVSPQAWCKRRAREDRFCCIQWLPPVLARFVIRVSFLAFYVLIAEATLGFGLQTWVSLVGAIATTALTFYLPFIFHMLLFFSELNCWRFAMYTINILFGIFLAITGVYFTIQGASESNTAGLFSGVCHENAQFIGSGGGRHDALDEGGYSCSTGNRSFYEEFYVRTCGTNGSILCGQYGNCWPPKKHHH